MGPLAGVRVVELAGIGPAPFCAMVLADLGADVVRIDRPAPPGQGPAGGVDTLTEGVMTRGRRSVVLDLKDPHDLTAALDLVADADALVEGFRPGVTERLGLGPDACHARNPRLVYGRVTGWGRDGPLAPRAGHDINYLALAGALAPVGRGGDRPVPPLNVIGDFAGGSLLLALGVAAALVESGHSGRGQVVDAAMVDGSSYLMTMMYELLGRGAWVEEREANPNDGGAPFYRTYETSDGEYVAVGAMEARFWATLLDGLGLDAAELGDPWDRAHWPELANRLSAVFRTRSREAWTAVFAGVDACVTPVLRMSEAPSHPHHVARGAFTTLGGAPVPSPPVRFTPAGDSADDGRI